MSDQTTWVSRPIGGIPASADLVPSLVFALVYALLLPVIIYKFFIRKPRSWNGILFGTTIFAVERIVWSSMRAYQATHPEARTSGGQMNYIQGTVGLGFIGISADLIGLLRCLLVNATLPENGASKDRRPARRWYRYFCYVFGLSFLAASIPGIVASNSYNAARSNQELADKNLGLLTASAGIVLTFQLITIIVCLLAAFLVKEVDRTRCFELVALTCLLIIVPIYRLFVLRIRTIDVFEPLSSSARTAFYVFHLVPEWICIVVLLGTNVRARFQTGRWGDYEMAETPRDQRLEKEKAALMHDGEQVDGSRAV